MDKVRYGVIGVKGVGKVHIRAAVQNEQVELVALADINEELVKEKSAHLGVRGFTDHRDLLDAGMVDAVSIATPHDALGPIGLDCLKAGVHVFVEKPFAIRVSEADAMIETAKENGLKIAVGFQYRLFRTSRTLKDLIDRGAIGKIMQVLWTWGELRPESYFARDLWRGTFRHAGGGVLMNQASHDLDLICWLIGKPVQVSALVGNQLHKTEVEDIAGAQVLFANGALGSLQFSINHPRAYSVRQLFGDKGTIIMPEVKSLTKDHKDHILLGTYCGFLPTMTMQLPGSHEQPDISWQKVHLTGRDSHWTKWINPGWLSWQFRLLIKGKLRKPASQHSLLFKSFIDAILTGGEPMVSGESARASVELANAILLSAIRKKVVSLPIDREEYDQLFQELIAGRVQVPQFR